MTRGNDLPELRQGYSPRSSQEAFIVPLLAEAIVAALDNHVGPPAPGHAARAIDVGCGGQPFRAELERRGYAYTSLDVRQNAAGTVDVLGMIDRPLPPQLRDDPGFDLVFCTEVLEHVEDWRTAFANLAALLAPGGKLLVTCPHFYHLHEEPFDFWRPTPHALHSYATTAGLQVVQQQRLGSGWDVLGTLLACSRPRRSGRSVPGRALAAVAELARKAAFVVVRSHLPHRLVPLDGSVYLSNLAVFQRPPA